MSLINCLFPKLATALMPQNILDRIDASQDGVDGVNDAVGGDDVGVDDVGVDRSCRDLQNWALENLL